MMINLRNLEMLQKVVNISCFKTGDKKKDSVYVDFDREVLVLHNERFNGEISFSFEKGDDEDYVNFFVDMTKLFYVLKEMNSEAVSLTFEEKEGTYIPTFKNGSDLYKISYIISEDEDLELEFEEDNFKKVNFSQETIKLIDQASIFVDMHEEMKFNSVALSTDNGVYGVTPTRFFTSTIKETLEDNIFIHRDITKVLSAFTVDFDFFYDDTKFVLKNDFFRFIYSVGHASSTIPSETNKAGVISYDNMFSLNKKSFLDLLKFFDPFYVSDSKPIRFTVMSEKELKVSTVSSYDVVEKIIPFASDSSKELLGYSAKFNATMVKNALSVLDSDIIDFYADSEKIGISITDSTKSKEIVIIKYAGDE